MFQEDTQTLVELTEALLLPQLLRLGLQSSQSLAWAFLEDTQVSLEVSPALPPPQLMEQQRIQAPL